MAARKCRAAAVSCAARSPTSRAPCECALDGPALAMTPPRGRKASNHDRQAAVAGPLRLIAIGGRLAEANLLRCLVGRGDGRLDASESLPAEHGGAAGRNDPPARRAPFGARSGT